MLGGFGDIGRNPDITGNFSSLPLLTETVIPLNVSVFDPVLTEILFHWFCTKDGKVLDPFAGGIECGAVMAFTGRDYYGVDIREEQIAANLRRLSLISPPYYDLERYSDDSRDISNMTYEGFISTIIIGNGFNPRARVGRDCQSLQARTSRRPGQT